jgi:hypothetical protein
MSGQCSNVTLSKKDFPFGRSLESGNTAKQGRFPTPTPSQKEKQLSGGNFKRNVTQRGNITKLLCYPSSADFFHKGHALISLEKGKSNPT